MKLLLDLGNTHLKFALAEAELVPDSYEVIASHYVHKSLPKLLKDLAINEICIASVASRQLTLSLAKKLKTSYGIEPLIAKSQSSYKELVNGYQDYTQLGVDRWLALVAAHEVNPNRASLVIDCGTCITIDYINPNQQHEGGIILPGMNLMQNSVVNATANCATPAIKLPRQHQELLGASTSEAIFFGTHTAAAATINFYQRSFRATDPKVFITGGASEALLADFSFSYEYEKNLVLTGLNYYLKNIEKNSLSGIDVSKAYK